MPWSNNYGATIRRKGHGATILEQQILHGAEIKGIVAPSRIGCSAIVAPRPWHFRGRPRKCRVQKNLVFLQRYLLLPKVPSSAKVPGQKFGDGGATIREFLLHGGIVAP